MRRIVLLLAVVFLTGQVVSAADFYGSVRLGYWYDMQDEDLTGGEARTDMQYCLFSTSRFGANFKGEDYTGKVEFSLSGAGAKLRLIWGEYDLGMMKVLIGQNYTGFFDLPNQATSIIDATENLMRGYGLMYDSRHPMIRLSMSNGAYLIFMAPKKVDPAGAGGVDALFPKINLGYRMNLGNLMLHPTFGINMSQYNEDFSAGGIDDTVLAYAAALTAKYCADKLSLLAQGSYGQNVADYGMGSATIGNAGWDGSEVLNATTLGGFLEVSYKLCSNKSLAAGVGYFSGDRDDLNEADTAMTAYLQAKINLHDKMFIMPEVGLIDEAEDGMGNKQGSHTYFGLNFQADFDLNVK